MLPQASFKFVQRFIRTLRGFIFIHIIFRHCLLIIYRSSINIIWFNRRQNIFGDWHFIFE